MKVKELMKVLKNCNPNANVCIVVGDEDDNFIDTYDFEIHGQDVDEYVEFFVYNKE